MPSLGRSQRPSRQIYVATSCIDAYSFVSLIIIGPKLRPLCMAQDIDPNGGHAAGRIKNVCSFGFRANRESR